MAARAAVALGSNLGDRSANLQTAIAHLAALGWIAAASGFHDTAPVGYLDQPRFLNAACVLETELTPLELLRALLAIEQTMGRVRAGVPAKGPRVIDLDLLLYDDVVFEGPELTVPHPRMHERAFVLAPLAEIAGEWVHPVARKTVAELLAALRCSAR